VFVSLPLAFGVILNPRFIAGLLLVVLTLLTLLGVKRTNRVNFLLVSITLFALVTTIPVYQVAALGRVLMVGEGSTPKTLLDVSPEFWRPLLFASGLIGVFIQRLHGVVVLRNFRSCSPGYSSGAIALSSLGWGNGPGRLCKPGVFYRPSGGLGGD